MSANGRRSAVGCRESLIGYRRSAVGDRGSLVGGRICVRDSGSWFVARRVSLVVGFLVSIARHSGRLADSAFVSVVSMLSSTTSSIVFRLPITGLHMKCRPSMIASFSSYDIKGHQKFECHDGCDGSSVFVDETKERVSRIPAGRRTDPYCQNECFNVCVEENVPPKIVEKHDQLIVGRGVEWFRYHKSED